MRVYGGIEAGGTKFVCGIGNEAGQLLGRTEFPTTTPDETIRRAVEYFAAQPQRPEGIGIGSFGPIDLNPRSPKLAHHRDPKT